jgi:hypothetical protein
VLATLGIRDQIEALSIPTPKIAFPTTRASGSG